MEYSESVDRLNRILVRAHRIIQGELLRQGIDDLVPSHGAVLEYLNQAGIPQPVTELTSQTAGTPARPLSAAKPVRDEENAS